MTSLKCIPDFKECDTDTDCEDGSDEDPAKCNRKLSFDHFFFFKQPSIITCFNVAPSRKPEKSRFPPPPPLPTLPTYQFRKMQTAGECEVGEFHCKDGTSCIDVYYQCDSIVDCKDSSDEDEEYCSRIKQTQHGTTETIIDNNVKTTDKILVTPLQA